MDSEVRISGYFTRQTWAVIYLIVVTEMFLNMCKFTN